MTLFLKFCRNYLFVPQPTPIMWTSKSLLATALILLGLLHDQADALDIRYNNRKVTMQEEVETVLITTDFKPAFGLITEAEARLAKIMESARAATHSQVRWSSKTWAAKQIKAFEGMQILLDDAKRNLFEVFTERQSNDEERKSRALEFLGDVFSKITGVPSATDHRLIIEKLKLLKLDNDGIQSMMAKTTREQKEILSALHVHSTSFSKITHDLQSIKMNQLELQNNAASTLKMMELQQKIVYYVMKVNELTQRAKNIMQDSKNEFLSQEAIGYEGLTEIIGKIRIKHIHIHPVFGERDVGKYFSTKLAHSWPDKKEKSIYTVLQIPLVNSANLASIAVLPTLMTKHPELDLAVIDTRANAYRFLSDSEYKECLNVETVKICQKRKIIIHPIHSCILDTANLTCNAWDYLVAHDLSNTDILFMSTEEQIAVLECMGKKKEKISLPLSGILNVRADCKLGNENFTIDILNYHRFTGKADSTFRIQKLQWESLEGFQPVKNDDLMKAINETDRKILDAMDRATSNEELLAELRKDSRERWAKAEAEFPLWQRWGIWALSGANLLILMLVIACMIVSRCKANTNIIIPQSNFSPTGTRPKKNKEESPTTDEIYKDERAELERARRDQEHRANRVAQLQRIYDTAN
jgi:hypothetical protein